MSFNISQPYELIEYTLNHESLTEPIIIEEPIGWKDDLMNIKRSEKNFTTVTKYSTNLEFFGVGANTLTQIYKNYGIEAEVVLIKRIQDPEKQEFKIRYYAILDGYAYVRKNDKCKVNTLESRLTREIKGYRSEKVEMTRTTAMNGLEIPELETKRVNIIGKDILLVSKFGVRLDQETLHLEHKGSDTTFYTTFPMDLYADSHIDAADVTNYKIQNRNSGLPGNGSTQNMFWSISEEDIILDKMKIDVKLNVTDYGLNQMKRVQLVLYLLKFEDVSVTGGSTQYKYKSRELLEYGYNSNGGSSGESNMVSKTIEYNNTFYNYEIKKGESLALAMYEKSYDGEDLLLEMERIDVELVSNSFEEGAQADCILPMDLFTHLARIMSARTDAVVVSNYFGRKDLGYEEDGPGAYVGVTSGFLARGFRDKPLTTSWKDAIESYGAVLNVSYVVEKIGFKEFIRIEPTDYFFTGKRTLFENNVATKKIEIKVKGDLSYNGIEIGYVRGAEEYEEADSLDEFNGRINWITPLAGAETMYTKLSEYRADSTGLVFALRKPIKTHPTDDTSYDKDIFLLDMKPPSYGLVLEQRVWQDDFAQIPEGLYSPSTATNLRLCPSEMFKRHERYFGACLNLYKDKQITFGSGVGNVLLVLDGEVVNRNINILDLAQSSYRNFEISFDYNTDATLEEAMSENIYGIFEFKDSRGTTWQFRLFEFKQNKYKGLLINGIQ